MGRVFNFFRDVRLEMQKVVWPSKQETLRYSVMVVVFSLVVAVILGAADFGLLKLFEVIIDKA
jgi:preprotein translocase subunit SecE